jgi:hypothetical protein
MAPSQALRLTQDAQPDLIFATLPAVRMGEIVARLRAAGETVLDGDLARISPLAYAHVIPNGTYVFERSRRHHIAPNTLP